MIDLAISKDNIVLGCSLQALLFSFYNDFPFICTREIIPHEFDFFESNLDLSDFYSKQIKYELKTPKGIISLGIQKEQLWTLLYNNQKLQGLSLFPKSASSISIQNGYLKCISSSARMLKVSFKNAYIFDNHEIFGLSNPIYNKEYTLVVYDFLKLNSTYIEYDLLETKDQFVNKIFFYPSPKSFYNHLKKDGLSVSFCNKEQVSRYEYSNINTKFKTKFIMNEAGIKGCRLDSLRNHPLKVSVSKREIIPQNSSYIYSNSENMQYMNNISCEEIISKFLKTNSNSKKFLRKIFRKRIFENDRIK